MFRTTVFIVIILVNVINSFSIKDLSTLILDLEISKWIKSIDYNATIETNKLTSAEWWSEVNISQYTQELITNASLELTKFSNNLADEGNTFQWEKLPLDSTNRRYMKKITEKSHLNESQNREFNEITSNMSSTYSTAVVCPKADVCWNYFPEIEAYMSKAQDYDNLAWVWNAWSKNSTVGMREKYAKYVDIYNIDARLSGYKDNAEAWKDVYEVDDLEEIVDDLFETLKPLYENLHTYVRVKLREVYRDHENHFPKSGHIPIHITGDVWGMNWMGIEEKVRPYKDVSDENVDANMAKKKYSELDLFKLAEKFYVSMGFDPMVDKFWKNSLFVKPNDRKVDCYPSASDMHHPDKDDFRIKMCTTVDLHNLDTIHHEMGHIQYYMEYRQHNIEFRTGANPGFHEAVGDSIMLSVKSPDHQKKLGFRTSADITKEIEINTLMAVALEKLPALPWTLIVDKWRWGVFNGSIPKEDYNKKFWELKCAYQGLSPPVERTEDNFDPGSKYHIADNVKYIRYFIARLLQFQFHEKMCNLSGHTGPLYRCDNQDSKEAGDGIRAMLKLGSSVHWREALNAFTGSPNMTAKSILAYFEPLNTWLDEYLTTLYPYEPRKWDPKCPDAPEGYQPVFTDKDENQKADESQKDMKSSDDQISSKRNMDADAETNKEEIEKRILALLNNLVQ